MVVGQGLAVGDVFDAFEPVGVVQAVADGAAVECVGPFQAAGGVVVVLHLEAVEGPVRTLPGYGLIGFIHGT
ncbi:hypothetical protein [Methylomonas methanica]|uniref:hypothetical protein n=1 Tax=Methylomonas methanica TaxID=421 RepID=UPI00059CC03D|nr:hypothetical protein [Methylomonas methanica]